MFHNENFINRLVGVTKSSKCQALQVQLLVTTISTQFFSEKTMILLALHQGKKFLYPDLTYPGLYLVYQSVQPWSLVGLFNYNALDNIVQEHLFDQTLNAARTQTMFIITSSALVAAQIFQLVLFRELMVENKIKNHRRKLNTFQKIVGNKKKKVCLSSPFNTN